tara:strand:+ start:140 stop:364 length:225 start_codon:yes stop_codon:yes gene_type:complete
MTKDDILRMGREAGMHDPMIFLGAYDRFAKLVAAVEREECAKVCEAVQQKNEDNGAWMWEAKNCAAAIRARGNT